MRRVYIVITMLCMATCLQAFEDQLYLLQSYLSELAASLPASLEVQKQAEKLLAAFPKEGEVPAELPNLQRKPVPLERPGQGVSQEEVSDWLRRWAIAGDF